MVPQSPFVIRKKDSVFIISQCTPQGRPYKDIGEIPFCDNDTVLPMYDMLTKGNYLTPIQTRGEVEKLANLDK